MDQQIKNLQRSIDRRRLERGKEYSIGERLKESADLFDDAMRWTRMMIQSQNPSWSDADVLRELERRKQIACRVSDRGIYQDCGVAESNDRN